MRDFLQKDFMVLFLFINLSMNIYLMIPMDWSLFSLFSIRSLMFMFAFCLSFLNLISQNKFIAFLINDSLRYNNRPKRIKIMNYMKTLIYTFSNHKKIPKLTRTPDSSIILQYQKPKYSLIWLHGLGDSSEGFLSFFTHSASPLYKSTRIKLIQAPSRPNPKDHSILQYSWYDIFSLNRFVGDERKIFDFSHIQQSSSILQSHVDKQVQYWTQTHPNSPVNPYHRIFIGGFSQGGALSLHYAMESDNIVAGVITLSAYLFRESKLKNSGKLPVCLMHGEKDTVIEQFEAKKSYERILKHINTVEYHKLPHLSHTVCLDQFSIMNTWLYNSWSLIERHYSGKIKD